MLFSFLTFMFVPHAIKSQVFFGLVTVTKLFQSFSQTFKKVYIHQWRSMLFKLGYPTPSTFFLSSFNMLFYCEKYYLIGKNSLL